MRNLRLKFILQKYFDKNSNAEAATFKMIIIGSKSRDV